MSGNAQIRIGLYVPSQPSASPTGAALHYSGEETGMTTYGAAELFLNTSGRRGEAELRAAIANGASIHDRDRDGMSAMDIAQDISRHDKSMRLIAPKLVEILKSLGA